jgi:hypothetical protein
MICPVCKEQGLTSTLIDHGTEVTCLGYFPYHDEAGVRHSHNPNRHSTTYTCSRGHRCTRYFHQACPACGEVKDPETIKVHP